MHDLAWWRFVTAAATSNDSMRRMTLATADATGADLRMVILRAVRPADRVLSFHTDARAPKCAAIAADPRVGLLLWDEETQVQLRCRATARLIGSGGEADAAWAWLNARQRALYDAPHAPGAAPDGATTAPRGRAAFRIVECQITAIDMLYLRDEGHARWLIDYADPAAPVQTAVAP